ncbi:MAG TPA: 16S rRNA (adenine(1518)-N(6)/adenine(1519)-N(6))-dimethyltransferase RsmA [Nitrospira sp.]|nr:16S rRNA (adenine(1518)-N(6)/adenine(1519)-N(6))-dimethyltransferase RsmA [Nitrospira sp.]
MPHPAFPPANKRLGQHFLIDQNIVRKIVAAAELTSEDTVVEIGPGRGVLTEALAPAVSRVVAIEIDRQLHEVLQGRQAEWPNVELIRADALTYPFETLPAGAIVVANLPYYISTPLLFKFLDHRLRFPRLVLMLQSEVAARLVAKAGDADYGVLSVMAQYAADVTKVFKVSANCFRPRPEVGSAVVVVRPRTTAQLSPPEECAFAALVKAAFAHRRKTLANSLRDEGYVAPTVTKALEGMHLMPAVRAESLAVAQFIELARRLVRASAS